MKRKLTAGLVSVSLPVFIQDTSSTTGGGLSGVTHASSGLVIEYRRHGQSDWTSVTPVTKTLGTYVSGGIVADGALGGAYEVDLPDAAFASGARWVVIRVRGVANMLPVLIEIELDVVNYQDAVRFGLTALPNVASGSAGALVTSGIGTAQLATSSGLVTLAGVTHTGAVIPTVTDVTTKTGYSLSAGGVQAIWDALTSALTTVGSIGKLFVDNINATISSRSTYAGGDTAGTTTLLSRITSALTITSGKVTVGTNEDKTGYSLLEGTGLGNQTTDITGSLSGSVGSVTGAVGSINGVSFPANFASMGINASGHVLRVSLVDTTTTNTDMRGTDNAALASAWTATRAGYLDGVLLASNYNQRTVQVTGSGHVAADIHELQAGVISAGDFASNWLTAAGLATDAATEIATAVAATQILSRLDSMVESNGGGQFRFDTIALSLAPAGGGGGGGTVNITVEDSSITIG